MDHRCHEKAMYSASACSKVLYNDHEVEEGGLGYAYDLLDIMEAREA